MHLSLRWDTPPENLPTQQNGLRLWQGTRDTRTHTHTCFDTHTHTHIDGHMHTCYTPTISGVHSLTHLFVCSLHLWRVSVVDSLNNMREAESLGASESDHLFIKANACYSEQRFA